MAWESENRRNGFEKRAEPYVNETMKAYLREVYFPRYPTKRAVVLPGLHLIQHTYNWIPMQAMQELAEFLEVAPSEVLDTATFYEEYWLKPKGKYLLQVCRSLSCELCGSKDLTRMLKKKLGIEAGETTADGKFTLVELECLGSCGTAPVAMINEVLHEEMTPESLEKIIDKLPNDPHDYHDPTIDWEPSDEDLTRHG